SMAQKYTVITQYKELIRIASTGYTADLPMQRTRNNKTLRRVTIHEATLQLLVAKTSRTLPSMKLTDIEEGLKIVKNLLKESPSFTQILLELHNAGNMIWLAYNDNIEINPISWNSQEERVALVDPHFAFFLRWYNFT